jgi:hypothetical protein
VASFTDSHTLLDVADQCVPVQGLLRRMVFAPKAAIEKLKKAQVTRGLVPPFKQPSMQCLQEFKLT